MCPYMTSFSKAFITTSPRILENLHSHLRIELKCTEVSNSRGTCVLRNSSKEKRYLVVIKTSALQSAANYSVLHVALFYACSSKKRVRTVFAQEYSWQKSLKQSRHFWL